MTIEQDPRCEGPLEKVDRYLEAMLGTNAHEYGRVSGILDSVLFNQQIEATRETHTWAVISALNGYRPDEQVVRGRRIGAVLHVLHGAIVGNHVEQTILPEIGIKVHDTLQRIGEEDVTLPKPQETISQLLDTIVSVESMVRGGPSDAIVHRARMVNVALIEHASKPQQ